MKRLLTGSIVCILSLGLGTAVYSSDENDNAPQVSIPPALQDYYYSGKLPEKLSYSIDLWYDAALKGNDAEIKHLEGAIYGFLDNDIRADEQLLGILAKQISPSDLGSDTCDNQGSDSLSNPASLDQSALTQAWDVVNAKKMLQDGISKTSAFSNKYRLMGDYIELLRRELDLPRLKLASSDRSTANNSSPLNGTQQD